MTRGTRTAIVVGSAVATAMVASLAAYQAASRMPVREVEIATSFVAAATRPLPAGSLIAEADVKLIAWPANTPISGAIATNADVVGRGLITPVAENEPITEGKLASREAGAGLPPMIPLGMRALALRVNDRVGVAGFVVPGTYVDVVATLKEEQTSVTRIVAAHIRVLAVGTKVDTENATAATPIAATVVTLLVTPNDAERIALADGEAQIVLTLRNPLDTAIVETAGVRMAELIGRGGPPKPAAREVPVAKRPVVAASAAAAPPAPQVYVVEAFRGLKRTEETVQ